MKNKKYVLIPIFLICIIYSLLNSQEVLFHSKKAIVMCTTSLIPALFVFIVLTKIFSSVFSKIPQSKKMNDFCNNYIGISSTLLPICIMSVFCGTPTSCIAICNSYKNKLCSKAQAENACILSSFCSMSFILGFACSMFSDKKAVLIIWISNFFSVITIYFLIMKSRTKNSFSDTYNNSPQSFSNIVTHSISGTIYDLITLSSYVIFFYTLSSVICERISICLQNIGVNHSKISIFRAFIFSFFEMTNGTVECNKIYGYGKILMTSFCISFMGLSILFQVNSFMSLAGLSSKKFIKAKVLSSLLGPIYSMILLFLIPVTRPVFNDAAIKKNEGVTFNDLLFIIISTVVCFVAGEILNHFDKKHKK